MKRLLFLFLMLYSIAISAQNSEFRASWVITWDYISASSTVEENKARIIQILENHKKANMNAVLWQVRQSGSVYYQSSYEPWGSYAGGVDPGFDPLAFVIEEAHKRGMEVHAWFNTFMISSMAADRVTAQHPDWICTNGDGTAMTKYYALSPGIEAVREYTRDVAMEIVNNYDIDGLHLDYIRWNEYDNADMTTTKKSEEFPLDGMISEEKLTRLKSLKSETTRFIFDQYHPYSGGVPSGYSSWADWRRASVTEFVEMLHDSIQQVKPYVRLSAAALGKYMLGGETGWNGYYVVFQDAALWFNQGYVDQLTPMHYHWLTGSAFLSELESDWEPYIGTGISAGRMYTVGPGSYILVNNDVLENHEQIVTSCRTKDWVDGFQFFSYGTWRDNNYFSTAAESFFSRKTRIREIQMMTAPAEPSLSIAKIDSLHYSLTVTPGDLGNRWYVIYRSADATFDSENDDIIFTTFGNSEFTTDDQFSGLQNYNGKYYYFALAYNRYWNGSQPSASVITDDIPSLAPVVTATTPDENGSIAVSDAIAFTFSKTMDESSLAGAFQISPSAATSFIWSAEGKILTVSFPGNLSYDTDYTVTLGSNLTDVNGKALDGDGDGVPGEDFVLNFMTSPQDSRGPEIKSSTVADMATGVDIGSVFSFAFDELILGSSLTASSISFETSTGQSVSFKYSVYQIDGTRTVVSVQPDDVLDYSKDYLLTFDGSISDILGNTIGSDIVWHFRTSTWGYSSEKIIDEFSAVTSWKAPTYSGSTVGVISASCTFSLNTDYALPAAAAKNSSALAFEWNPDVTSHLIREYLDPASTPGLVTFDTTYVLQVYIYGDSSNTKFRFCIDENDGAAYTDHEVSTWYTINWYGWKLVEWKMSDASSIGSWISANNTLAGPYYRTDSYQLSMDSQSDVSGILYFDRYRAVKKTNHSTGIENVTFDDDIISCRPNPSSGQSNLVLKITEDDKYTVNVYNLGGQLIDVLLSEDLPVGEYCYPFGERYKSGVYIIEIRTRTARRCIRFIKS